MWKSWNAPLPLPGARLPWQTVWWFLNKLNIERLHDPAAPLPGPDPKAPKIGVRTKTVHECSAAKEPERGAGPSGRRWERG